MPRNFSRVFALAGDSTMTRDLRHGHTGGGRSHIRPESANRAWHPAVNNIGIPEKARRRLRSRDSLHHIGNALRTPASRICNPHLESFTASAPYRPPAAATARPAPSSSKRLARTVAAGRSSARARSSAERPSSRSSASKMRRASGEISAGAAGAIATGAPGAPDRGEELGEDVLGAAAEDRPVAQELVRPDRGRREDDARHREDVASEVVRRGAP